MPRTMTRQRRPGAARRKRVWARESDNLVIPAGGSEAFDLLQEFVFVNGGARPLGATVGRVRITAAFETTSLLEFPGEIFVGVLVDDANDANPGVTFRPDTNKHLDWMYWSKRFPPAEATSPNETMGAFWEIDIKAMRRMEELSQTIWLVVAAGAGVAGNYAFGASTLVVMP